MGTRVAAFLVLTAVLGAIAIVGVWTRPPDEFYHPTSERFIVPGCAELHCFRVLAPWTIAVLPGALWLKWKMYAVVCNAAAGVAVFDLCLVLGLSVRAGVIAGLLTAFGFGSFYTMWELYSADPVMFWLTPVVMKWAFERRDVLAGVGTAVGLLGKEFIVVPLAMMALVDGWRREWTRAIRAIAWLAIAVTVWLAFNFWLRTQFQYTYGPNKSPDIFRGSYLAVWLSYMSPLGAASAIFNQFGVTFFLIPIGWFGASRELRRLSLAALPFACAFAYVQQPDRALWNFNFLTSPLAALVLEGMSTPFVALFLLLYATANLKVGGQIAAVPQARYFFAAGLVLAVIAIVKYVTRLRA